MGMAIVFLIQTFLKYVVEKLRKNQIFLKKIWGKMVTVFWGNESSDRNQVSMKLRMRQKMDHTRFHPTVLFLQKRKKYVHDWDSVVLWWICVLQSNLDNTGCHRRKLFWKPHHSICTSNVQDLHHFLHVRIIFGHHFLCHYKLDTIPDNSRRKWKPYRNRLLPLPNRWRGWL